jgi:hypothetical protein
MARGEQHAQHDAQHQQQARDPPLRGGDAARLLVRPRGQQHVGQRTAGQHARQPVGQREHQHGDVAQPGSPEGGGLRRFAHEAGEAADEEQCERQRAGLQEHGGHYRRGRAGGRGETYNGRFRSPRR